VGKLLSPWQSIINWRSVMAPSDVLKYLVTHEAVHLAVPDHSHRFWLTVSSLCPGAERARQWLSRNGHKLMIDLSEIVPGRPQPRDVGRAVRFKVPA
jgi:hypothetical protein